jgi:transcriptional regulator with XRE-family HTH domain
MEDERSFLKAEFADQKAREQYAADLLDSYIALQIKTLRQQRKWSQKKLASLARKHQSQISPMEQIDFRSWKISTLRQLAKAFDLALVVKFESFGRFLDEVLPVERAALERPSFADDPAFHASGSVTRASDAISASRVLTFHGNRSNIRLRQVAASSGQLT